MIVVGPNTSSHTKWEHAIISIPIDENVLTPPMIGVVMVVPIEIGIALTQDDFLMSPLDFLQTLEILPVDTSLNPSKNPLSLLKVAIEVADPSSMALPSKELPISMI